MRTLKGAAAFAAGLWMLWPSTALANVGLPMIIIVWPASWVLFVPVVLIEAWFAQRLLQMSLRSSLRVSACANLASTLVGIPLAWGAAYLVEMLFGLVLSVSMKPGQEDVNLFVRLIYPFLTAPWLGPQPRPWMIPAASLILCIPFFFASVFSEAWVARRLVPEGSRPLVKPWAWRANLVSYGGIALLLAGTLLAKVLS